jgi:selenocysteine-specific elongation factor
MILGTAGHIDHGKTTLVRALTGVDTDRLPEEKRRGITIELGFAPLVLPGVGTLGVVDVPGHEAFVRTMVAGATGIDLALLVVAADEGMMPQTREHLAVLSILGVHRGVVALTKSELVDPDWLALVEDDVREALAASPLAVAPIIPVSATTGAGLDALRAALADAAREVTPRGGDDLFRLPIDRAFTVRGTGTVVTGTVWSGTLHRDDILRLMPEGTTVRARGLHAHGHAVERVQAGDRAAIALAGVDLDRVQRGGALVRGDAWRLTRVLRADVELLPDAPRPVGARARVRLHLGTADVGARIVVRGGALAPGAGRAARVVLDEPIVARAGDRFVLRAESPMATIGGGVVTDPLAPARARPWAMGVRAPDALLRLALADAGANGLDVDELTVRLGLPPHGIGGVVDVVRPWRMGKRLVAAEVAHALREEALAILDRFHAEHPLDAGAAAGWLRSRLHAPDEVSAALLARLASERAIVAEQGIVRRPDFAPTLSEPQLALRTSVLGRLEVAGAEPPSIEELAVALGTSSVELLTLAHLLAREGTIAAVEPTRFYLATSVARLLEALDAGMAAGQDYGPAELREILGFSRKFLIPFMEFCDREGYTLRDATGRRRRGNHLLERAT